MHKNIRNILNMYFIKTVYAQDMWSSYPRSLASSLQFYNGIVISFNTVNIVWKLGRCSNMHFILPNIDYYTVLICICLSFYLGGFYCQTWNPVSKTYGFVVFCWIRFANADSLIYTLYCCTNSRIFHHFLNQKQ